MSSDRVVVQAPAKVNLSLRVGPLGPDGYHELVSVFHAVSLYEEVSASPASPGSGITLAVRGGEDAAEVPLDASNLAVRAARLLATRAEVAPDVHLTLRKTAPVAGGMAGGSADAAAALLACDLLWNAGMSREGLLALAAELGSDVPFSLVGGTALGTGRGDVVTPVLARGEHHWVFAMASRGLSTPTVFAELDRLRAAQGLTGSERPLRPRVSDAMAAALLTGDPAALGACLENDLAEAAVSLRPELGAVLRLGEEHGALGTAVSGSGPTIALLAAGPDHALELAVALTASGLAERVERVTGPVHGARQVEPVVTSPHHPSRRH